MFERYKRQTSLDGFGAEGQKRLLDSRLVLFGCGGVGSAVLPLLTGAGVGNITVVDGDVVSENNLHRQTLFSHTLCGARKALIATEKMSALNPDVKITAVCEFVRDCRRAAEIIADADIVIDATDNFASRHIVSEACASLDIFEIMSSAQGFFSQTILFGGGFRLADIVENEGVGEGSLGMPIFGPSAHLSGVWGAGIAVGHLAGKASAVSGFFQCYDFSTGKFNSGSLA